MLSRRVIIWSSLVCFVLSPAKADLYDDYINSVSKKPFASFLARTSDNGLGKPGHSYVAIGVELDNGLRVYERVFGYYPKNETAFEEVKAIFTKVSGDIRSKIEDVSWKVEYRVPLDEAKHQAALKVIDKWRQNDPKYNLFANGGKNCSSFAAEVAQAVGLKVPAGAGSKFPINFMTELRNMNKP
jgi:hypothetical protein